MVTSVLCVASTLSKQTNKPNSQLFDIRGMFEQDDGGNSEVEQPCDEPQNRSLDHVLIRFGIPPSANFSRHLIAVMDVMASYARRIFVFPGQGSLRTGLASSLAHRFSEARAVFDEVDSVLPLSPIGRWLCAGDQTPFALSHHAQPAILAYSIALYRSLMSTSPIPMTPIISTSSLPHSPHQPYRTRATTTAMLGHSVGEIVALCAAGSIALADAAMLLAIRGWTMELAIMDPDHSALQTLLRQLDGARQYMDLKTLMQIIRQHYERVSTAAAQSLKQPVSGTGMVALIPVSLSHAKGLCAWVHKQPLMGENGLVCEVANINSQSQVISCMVGALSFVVY